MKKTPAIERLESRIAPATFTVTSLADAGAGSLRQAILDANSAAGADDIVFQSDLAGVIKLNSNLDAITDDLTISGPNSDAASDIVIHGREQFSIININAASVTLQDLTIKKGLSAIGGGGIHISAPGENIVLNNLVITKNKAISGPPNDIAYGGGISVSGGTVELSDSVVSGNIAKGSKGTKSTAAGEGYGGGIWVAGDMTITNTLITGNTAKGGSGKAGSGANGADAYGGGIYVSDSASNVTISDSTITQNKAVGGNGAASSGTKPGGIGDNASGGGIYNYEGSVTIINTNITNNLAKGGNGGIGGGRADYGSGGGICNGDGEMTITDSIVTGNKASGGKSDGGSSTKAFGYGGGVYSTTDLTIQNTTISGNKATYGGGLYTSYGIATVTGSTISGNTAKLGGGVYLEDNSLTITNSTIAENEASADGGGIYKADGSLNLNNSTLSKNSAVRGGGLFIEDTATSAILISTIVAKNSASKGLDVFGEIDATDSLIGKVTAETEFGVDVDNIINTNPLLGQLQDNGGLTFTMLPKSNSPVIDAGNNIAALLTDQRGSGFARTSGSATDIGAVEVQTVM